MAILFQSIQLGGSVSADRKPSGPGHLNLDLGRADLRVRPPGLTPSEYRLIASDPGQHANRSRRGSVSSHTLNPDPSAFHLLRIVTSSRITTKTVTTRIPVDDEELLAELRGRAERGSVGGAPSSRPTGPRRLADGAGARPAPRPQRDAADGGGPGGRDVRGTAVPRGGGRDRRRLRVRRPRTRPRPDLMVVVDSWVRWVS